jgi:hypothetical protein
MILWGSECKHVPFMECEEELSRSLETYQKFLVLELQKTDNISTVPAYNKEGRKKEKRKEKALLKARKAEEKALANKKNQTDDYIKSLLKSDKNTVLKGAEEYLDNYLDETRKKRNAFISQLNANPISILIDQPEEEDISDADVVNEKSRMRMELQNKNINQIRKVMINKKISN